MRLEERGTWQSTDTRKDIAIKAVDNSAGVRKDAAKLTKAVKELSENKLAAPIANPASSTSSEKT